MDLSGKRVAIVGMGQTAVALAEFVLAKGGVPFVSEQREASRVEHAAAALRDLGVEYECGGHSVEALSSADLLVPSPGVDPGLEQEGGRAHGGMAAARDADRSPIARARDRGVPVVSELEVVFPYCRSTVLAVTGTNGKTTTTELLAALVRTAGKTVALAGNNAVPFSAAALRAPAPEYVVREVSSYQLDLVRTFRPRVGAVLNLSPDHLARHKTMGSYRGAKNRMFLQQQRGDVAVVNADDPSVRDMVVPEGVQRHSFSLLRAQRAGLWLDGDVIRQGKKGVAARQDIPLPGDHNVANALAALIMARAAGLDWAATLEGLRGFRGVEHRIEHVAAVDDVEFINDSKATNIDSLRVSLESFDRPVVLIAGGQGKGSDYGVLRPLIQAKVKAVVTLGEDAPKIEAAFGDVVVTERAGAMDDAVTRAAALAAPGEIVLLSPACASFDMYDNFEHRGRVFKACVGQLAARRAENGLKGRSSEGRSHS
jgi:UDP-N-acetylmuramoylalanine--D-glutamate ligase